MKTLSRRVSSVAPLLLLFGCSSSHELTRSTAPADVPVSMQTITSEDAYVARIEEIARRRGVQVVWVNRPQKRYR